MKKTIVWILLLALVVTLIGPAMNPQEVFAAEDSSEPENTKVIGFDLEASTSEVEAGTEFTVDLYVTENTGFMWAKIYVGFPEAALTVVDVNCADGVFGADVVQSASTESSVIVTVGTVMDALGMTDACYDAVGFVGTITFRVNDDYAKDFTVTAETSNQYVVDLEGNLYTFTVNNCQLDITNLSCEHSWLDATCTEPKTCELCGETEGEALGHDLTQHEAQAPTCTEVGWEAYECCSRCDYSTYVELPAEDHSYVDGICEHCGQEQVNPVLMGDANDDGVVNYLDAMLIAQYYVGDIAEADLNLAAADVNADGVVNYLDAMMVAQFYVGDIDSFPAEN